MRVGIDIGGTFTDLFLYDATDGRMATHKVLTTGTDPSRGAIAGLAELLANERRQPRDIEAIIHGTTLVVNAITERKGAVTGLLATEGFADLLDFRNERRYDAYDLGIDFPAPLVPRYLRREVRERVVADGTALVRPERAAVIASVQALVDHGVSSIAVCLLHSYRNPAHERLVAEWVSGAFPGLDLSVSSKVAPEIREYPRTATTAADAYVKPITRDYMSRLVSGFRDGGIEGAPFVMLSDGGVTTAADVVEFPIRIIESGPAAGGIATALWAARRGLERAIAFDMGGTTAKICLIDEGRPAHTGRFETARIQRYRSGSGIPLSVPSLKLVEIGSGGGSIAKINKLGLLQVGPESAGAEPGPACYGRGGTDATVTDANLVLGLIDPAFFLGGRFKLDAEASSSAIVRAVAQPLGIAPDAAAAGVYRVVSENMASAARVHCAEMGRDRRRYTLMAFGGGGPLHATYVARHLQIERVLVPPLAGLWSAVGLVAAAPSIELVHSWVTRIGNAEWDAIRTVYAEMRAEAIRLMKQAGVHPDEVRISAMADMRYVGQSHEILVAVPPEPLGPGTSVPLRENFERAYRQRYTTLLDRDIEVLVWRLRAAGAPTTLATFEPAADTIRTVAAGERTVYSPLTGRTGPFAVLRRTTLREGARIAGPAIIEESASTTVLWDGDRAQVEPDGSLDIRVALR